MTHELGFLHGFFLGALIGAAIALTWVNLYLRAYLGDVDDDDE